MVEGSKSGVSETLAGKKAVLIIEDSKAVSMLLKDFLGRLGYSDVHTAEDGNKGLVAFKDLTASGCAPIVFLDFALPDTDALSLITQILEIRPNTKVIIETASEKTEENIKQVMRLGAYHYLGKPIRFENLKSVVKTLEEEQIEEKPTGHLAREKQMLEILEKGIEEFYKNVEHVLESYTKISVARLSEFTRLREKDVLSYLRRLESKGKVVRLDEMKEISCPDCDSLKAAQLFHCPSCNSPKFKQGTLIEHYNCGNVSMVDTYKKNICPKCHKELKALGVDYKSMKNYYSCSDCDDKFTDLALSFSCGNCGIKFKIADAKWRESPSFKLKEAL